MSSIVLDFFSGSASTADAVMQYNAENKINVKYIMVQLNEQIDEKEKAFKFLESLGKPTVITELGKERIRRAGKAIFDELPKKSQSISLFDNNDIAYTNDYGFRVLKLDSSNMNDVYYNANSTSQSLFDNTVDNVKADRTPLDLLFQVMLELGIELSAKIEEKEVLSKKYFIVNDNDIVACFDNDVSNDVIKELAKIKPIYAVFRDSAFENDAANINCEQLFKSISPSTTIKVL